VKLRDSLFTGFPVLRVSRQILQACMDNTVNLKAYKMGGKPDLDSDSAEWTRTDCSGYVRWILHRASLDKPIMPEGSANQRDWCLQKGFKPTDYSNTGELDGRLRISFLPARRGKAGHVWLCWNGRTIESRGGRGPTRRAWDTPVLKNQVAITFVLTDSL